MAAPWCKVCGITNEQDALQAAAVGADALGFNFYPQSARFVEPKRASQICTALKHDYPHVSRVALFVDADADDVQAVLDDVDVDLLQFHGDETPQYCEQFSLPYIKVLGVTTDTDVQAFEGRFAKAWALLLDTHDPQLKGGTGRQFDWALWPIGSSSRLVLAGGLTPENVGLAAQRTSPFGVDVAGGVEGAEKGVKDHAKVKLFIEKAKHG